MKKTKISVLLMLIPILFCGCTRNAHINSKIDLNNVEYIVSFSGSDKSKFENSISVIYNNGSVNEYPLNSSMAIENGFTDGESYKFFSRQADIHYEISNNEIKVFHLLDDEQAGCFFGVFSANTSDNIDIQIMNCAATENGYLMKLIITGDESHSIDFYDKILCNAIRQDNLIIMSYIDLSTNYKDQHSIGSSKLAVFDLDKEKITSEFELPTIFRAEPDVKFLYLDGNVIFFSNKLNEFGQFDDESYLGIYSVENNTLDAVVTMHSTDIFQLYAYNSEIIILETNGKISSYDINLNQKNSSFVDIAGTIRKVHLYDNALYLATIDHKSNIEITEYDIDNGKTIIKTNIPLPKSIDWSYESFDFLPAI